MRWVTDDEAQEHFKMEYLLAVNTPWVTKPISYALYQTWRWCDALEKERKTDD